MNEEVEKLIDERATLIQKMISINEEAEYSTKVCTELVAAIDSRLEHFVAIGDMTEEELSAIVSA